MSRLRKTRRAVIGTLLLGCILLARAFPALADEDIRADFIAAMQRVQHHAPDEPDSPSLQAYVIYDYLVAARLRRDLAENPNADLDTTIDGFVKAHAGEPVERPLKHEWLLSLAKRRRWDWLLPRSVDATDAQVICARLSARLATGDTEGLGTEVLARWELPQKQPEECGGPFAWLKAQNLVTPELAENRTRAALLANNARLAQDFVSDVPATRAAPLMQWIQLLEAPKAAVAMLAVSSSTPVEADALVAGFTRLAISDPMDAAALLPSLVQRPTTSPALRMRLQRALALGEASSREPDTLASFGKLSDEAADTPVQEWRVRAALWAGDFAKALSWIEQMPPSLAGTPRWRYWRARAVGATSGAVTAAPLYAEIAGLRDYYGYLAADRLQQPYNLNIRPSPDEIAVQATLAAEPGLARAHALYDCGLTDDAGIEWAAALSAAKPSLKIQAARLASTWGWYAETIATLAQAGEWDDVALRYPRPYANLVAAAGKESRIPEDWIFAIMRQESLFRRDAVSHADARGLMQMQPATAAAVAHRAHLPAPSRDSLFAPDIAVKFGALYVRELFDKYGQLDQTLAAYNAGPISVARWRPHAPTDADIWIENIPYTETRSYVQHILEHIVAFATVRGGRATAIVGFVATRQSDIRRMTSAPVALAPPRLRAIVGGSVGNLVEWYDWYAYSATALYFAPVFFPQGDETAQLLQTAAVFAVGFFARPVGAWVMGRYADRAGRKAALTLSVAMMCLGSLVIAVTPSAAHIGVAAPLILLSARIFQGLSLGGEYGASATYMSEMAGRRHRGFWSSFNYVTLIGGQLIALIVLMVLQHFLSKAAMGSWGWRIPFVIGAGLAIVAYWMRRRMQESASFANSKASDPRGSIRLLLSTYPRETLTILGLTAGGSMLFYVYTTYMQKFLTNTAGFSKVEATQLSAATLVAFMLAQPLCGWLSDRIGRKTMLLIAFGGSALATWPIMTNIATAGSISIAFYLILAAVVLASAYTSISAVVKAELFPTSVRSLGVALPYALANAVFGGTAEFVALWFKQAGMERGFYVYASLLSAMSFVVALSMKDTRTHSRIRED